MKKVLFFSLSFLFSLSLFSQDIAGSSDHPILSRYPEAKIIHYYQKEYNELQFAQATKDGLAQDFLMAKGKHTSILYKGPEQRSTLEIFRNYEKAIQQAGGEILFSCEGINSPGGCDAYNKNYGYKFFDSVYGNRKTQDDQYLYSQGGSDDQMYLVAKFDQGNTLSFVEIGITAAFLGKGADIQLEILEQSKMDADLITAQSIKEQLDQYGKVQIYTIFFATNSHQIEEGSSATLDAIADYLRQYPQDKLYVVGHTDDTGKFDYNMSLSEKRAQAVVQAIQQLMGGADKRLKAMGVGPLSPEASNQNDKGQAANRRVELVKRLQ